MLATINWKPNNRELRVFGAVFLAGFALIGGWLLWKDMAGAAKAVWTAGVVVGGAALAAPPIARPFYWMWMGLAFVMGTVVSTVILAVIFFVILTPLGLAMRLAGRDALALKRKPAQASYWAEHPPLDDKTYYERLF